MAQVKKVTVKGTILDAVTKEPLTGATIGTQAEGVKHKRILTVSIPLPLTKALYLRLPL
ncbi:hypothetical protein [Mucilaginibacter antarcticus]|uniref:hypothetical protein n=1 Tax=Mucilaginibacter antarcticus TaxID=1855725 RepID=UPI003635F39B